jgi:hypothetical protein
MTASVTKFHVPPGNARRPTFTGVNGAGSTKRRRGREAMAIIRDAIKEILRADHPQTVRQVFYQLVVHGVIEKTEGEYQRTVIRLLSEMRLDGQIDWSWIVDESRRTRDTRTFNNISDALEHTAQYYRRSALRECDVYIEIWCEKEALSGIIWDVASDYDVPVVVSRGLPSLTQVYGSFVNVRNAHEPGKLSYLYQFGDHDPTGCLIPRTIKSRLKEFCQKYHCPFPTVERIALTDEHIRQHRLPTRPTKREGNSHANDFLGDSVELDALPSIKLRALVRECIERHISAIELQVLRASEESERDFLDKLAGTDWEAHQ